MAYRIAVWKSDGQDDGPRNNETVFPVCVAGFVYDDEPEDIADYVYERATNRPDKCVVVLMRNPGQQYQDFPDIDDAGAFMWFAGGPLVDQHFSVCLRFFRRYKERCDTDGNVPIDAIVCDFEPVDESGAHSFQWWARFPTKAENAALLAGLSATPEVKRFLPKRLRDVSESRWLAAMQSPSAAEVNLLAEWNAHDRRIMTASQRAIVSRAYFEVFGRAAPAIHNYDDINTGAWFKDHHGWSVAPTIDTMDGISAPALYMNVSIANTISSIYGPGGPGTTGTNAQNCSNYVINLLNRSNSIIGRKSAWLSNPRFDASGPSAQSPATQFLKYDAWREIFLHYAASGGEELLVCWGPSIKTAELDEMEELLRSTKRRLGFDPRRHKPVPFNSPTYTTNGYTTTFSSLDFSVVSY